MKEPEYFFNNLPTSSWVYYVHPLNTRCIRGSLAIKKFLAKVF